MTRRFVLTGGISLAAALGVSFARGLGTGTPAEALAALSDGCFAVGAVMLGMGILLRISETGFFDIFSYGLGDFWARLTLRGAKKEPIAFYDYKQLKATKRSSVWRTPLGVGLILMALSCAALFAWYRY